jgi:NarL family two-component system response regulator LiaR
MTTQTPIRILIADDHAVVREGLRALIEAKPDLELVGEAADGAEAVRLAHSLKPDVILLDLVMPRMDGIEAIREIKREDPAARILVLTSFAGDDKVFPAIKAGALGYLLKDSSSQALIQAIREVYRGESSLHPTIARKLIHEINRPSMTASVENLLTEREEMLLEGAAGGLSNQEIAETRVRAGGRRKGVDSSVFWPSLIGIFY